MKKILILFLSILLLANLSAQKSLDYIQKGNSEYKKKKFSEAEISYRRSLEKPGKYEQQALYNLGNSLYKQGKYAEAEQTYSKLIANGKLKDDELHQAWHNKGNALLKQEKYKESIEAYKKALKIKPDDQDTRYNLSYALKKLIQNQNQQQKQQNQQNKNKEENKQNQSNNQQNNQQENKQQQQMNQQKLSHKDKEQILKALSNKDKQTLEELRNKELMPVNVKPLKDW